MKHSTTMGTLKKMWNILNDVVLFEWVLKVRNFSGANVEEMLHNLMSIITNKPSHLIIHAGMNDVKRFPSREILDPLLNLESIVNQQVPDYKVIISTPTVRSAEGK